jgi:type IV secretory pathway ATPase VirB11/archaellum biosynthesis ATPase
MLTHGELLPACIRKVTVSNVVRDTNYLDGFVVLLRISNQQKVTVSNVVRDTNYPDGFVVLLSIST